MSKVPLKNVESARSLDCTEVAKKADPQMIEARELPATKRADSGLTAVEAMIPAAAKRRRLVHWSLALLLLTLAIACLASWISYHSRYVTSSNAIVRGHLAELGTRIAAVVASVEVEPGQQVARGDVLLRFDDEHLRAKADAARAELALLERELAVERMEIEHKERLLTEQDLEGAANLTASKATVAGATIQMEDAKKRSEVEKQLQAQGGVSAEVARSARAELETRIELLNASQAKYEALQATESRRRLARQALTIREYRVGMLEAQVAKARAALQMVQSDLEHTVLRAPESGVIVRRVVQPGASVKAGLPTLVMWLGGALWVEAWIDEADVVMFDQGSRAVVTFPSFSGEEFVGRVTAIGAASDYEMPEKLVPQSRRMRMRTDPVVNVRIELEAPPEKLRPGLSAVVAIERRR